MLLDATHKGFSWLELTFTYVLLSTVITSVASMLLVLLGRFSIANVLILQTLYVAILLAKYRGRFKLLTRYDIL